MSCPALHLAPSPLASLLVPQDGDSRPAPDRHLAWIRSDGKLRDFQRGQTRSPRRVMENISALTSTSSSGPSPTRASQIVNVFRPVHADSAFAFSTDMFACMRVCVYVSEVKGFESEKEKGEKHREPHSLCRRPVHLGFDSAD